MSCLNGSSYNMKADIYVPTKTQDANTGIINKVWELDETVNCLAKTIVRDTVGSNSSNVDIAEYLANVNDIIKIRTRSAISSENRVVNIRNSQGTIWVETNNISSSGGVSNATIFEPRGSTPILDFNGRVIEYETVLQRQEIQTLEVD